MHIDANLVVLYVFSVVVMIAMPGPVAVFVAGTGIVGGPKLALRAIAGTNAGSLVLIVLSMLVVQGLLSINETVFTLLKGGGALYIGYLGYQMLHDAGRAAAATPVATRCWHNSGGCWPTTAAARTSPAATAARSSPWSCPKPRPRWHWSGPRRSAPRSRRCGCSTWGANCRG